MSCINENKRYICELGKYGFFLCFWRYKYDRQTRYRFVIQSKWLKPYEYTGWWPIIRYGITSWHRYIGLRIYKFDLRFADNKNMTNIDQKLKCLKAWLRQRK